MKERLVSSDQRPGGEKKAGASPTLSCSSLATYHSPLTPIIPAPLATAALPVVPAPIFTTTSRIHVGAPTILFRERTTASQQFPDRRAMLSSNCALLTVDCELLFSPNSNHSRTYEPGSRKSNYSRTYAKQGGGGRYLSGNVSEICRRADILECGGSPPPLRATQCRQSN